MLQEPQGPNDGTASNTWRKVNLVFVDPERTQVDESGISAAGRFAADRCKYWSR